MVVFILHLGCFGPESAFLFVCVCAGHVNVAPCPFWWLKREKKGKDGYASGGDHKKGFNQRQLFVQQEHRWPFDSQEGPSEVGNCGGLVS